MKSVETNSQPKINVEKDTEVYEKYAKYLEETGYAVVWRYNTSEMTPYQVGKDIVKRLETIDPYLFILPDEPKYCIFPSMGYYKKEDLANEDVFYSPLESQSKEISTEKLDKICRAAFNGDEEAYKELAEEAVNEAYNKLGGE